MRITHGSGTQIDGSNPAFQSEVQRAFLRAPRITYPVAGTQGVERSPFVSVAPEIGTIFAVVHKHTDQLLVGIGTDIIMSHVDATSNGGLDVNTTTGVITLPAGSVFVLEAAMYTTQYSNSVGGWARYAFVDADTNLPYTNVASWHAVVMPVSATHNEGAIPVAGLLIETLTEMRVKLRVTAGDGTHTMRADSSHLRIQKIGSDSISYIRGQLRSLVSDVNGTSVADTTVSAAANYVRYSDDLTNAAWVKGANHTAAANVLVSGFGRLTTSTAAVVQDTYQILQDPTTLVAIMQGTEITAALEFIPESEFSNIRVLLGSAVDSVYVDFNPATGAVTTGVAGLGVFSGSPYTFETLALGHYRLTVRGTPKPGDTTTPTRLTITPTGSVANAAMLIGNPCASPGAIASLPYVRTIGIVINNPTVPRVVSGAATSLNYLTEYDVQVQDTTSIGATSALSSKVRFRTGLKALVSLSGVVGSNNWVEMLIGESAASVGADFHLRGGANDFPSAAGDGGSLLFATKRGGTPVQFYVISVSGVAPNRVARIALLTDTAASVFIDDTAGSNQATALVSSATGGVITSTGDDFVHTFNANGTFTPSLAGNVRILLVGGGAGGDGGVGGGVYGHGGGGGQVLARTSFAVTATAIPVVVGAGSAAAAINTQGTTGGTTTFNVTSVAGGSAGNNIGTGGNGGGSRSDIDGVITNYTGGSDSTWGAGGGAGADGASPAADDVSGSTGGSGYGSDITGTTVSYGRGGAGSGTGTPAPAASLANLGRGGNGHGTSPQAGGSGVVIVRLPMWGGRTRRTGVVASVS